MTPSSREVDPALRSAAAAATAVIERCCASTGRLGTPRPVGFEDFLPRFANQLPFGQPRGGARYADGSRNGGMLPASQWRRPDGSMGGPRAVPPTSDRLPLAVHYAVRANESDSSSEDEETETDREKNRRQDDQVAALRLAESDCSAECVCLPACLPACLPD